jgi:hypothetical protein
MMVMTMVMTISICTTIIHMFIKSVTQKVNLMQPPWYQQAVQLHQILPICQLEFKVGVFSYIQME